MLSSRERAHSFMRWKNKIKEGERQEFSHKSDKCKTGGILIDNDIVIHLNTRGIVITLPKLFQVLRLFEKFPHLSISG